MRLTEEQVARLKALEDRKGRLTPDVVVADAKKKASPLHSLFEWNTGKAAHAWWLETAREVIASVKLVIRTETVVLGTTFGYVRDPDVPGNVQGYQSTPAMRRDPERAREALVAELKRAASYVERCRKLALALGLEAEIEALIDQIVVVQSVAELAKAS